MAKNALAAVICAILSVACQKTGAEAESRYQGIVEFDQRSVGFELPGRVSGVPAVRGAYLHAGDRVAALDPELETTARTARVSDVQAAEAQLSLVKAGTRVEEVRSVEASWRAARASEDLLKKNLERERALRARNASTDAAVEDLEGRLERAVGERQSVEQRLADLRRGARSQERDAAEARVAAAKAAVELADQRLARHVLTAPVDGSVLDVHVKSGEIVMAGTPVVTLGDTKHPFADVFVPEGKLAGLVVGVPAEVRVDGEPASLSGVVETVAQRTEFTPRYLFSERERPNLVVRLRVRIDDPRERLHAGVPAFVAFRPERAGRK